jgi:hypothetical protein
MAHPDSAGVASIGLRAKTNRAVAVVLIGSQDAPSAMARTELSLVSPQVAGTFEPYHRFMDLPWNEAETAVREAAAAIEAVATEALAALARETRSRGFEVASVGIVGAPERRLQSIGNPHIRAHAAEGVLFRRVLELAARANGLRCRAFVERGFEALAASELKQGAPEVKARLSRLGQSVGSPWRADEKLAALAAWLVLPADRGKPD